MKKYKFVDMENFEGIKVGDILQNKGSKVFYLVNAIDIESHVLTLIRKGGKRYLHNSYFEKAKFWKKLVEHKPEYVIDSMDGCVFSSWEINTPEETYQFVDIKDINEVKKGDILKSKKAGHMCMSKGAFNYLCDHIDVGSRNLIDYRNVQKLVKTPDTNSIKINDMFFDIETKTLAGYPIEPKEKIKIITIEEAFNLYPEHNYFAQDKDGEQYLYKTEPTKYDGCWYGKDMTDACRLEGKNYKIDYKGNWEDSLTEKIKTITIEEAFKLFPEYNYFAQDENGSQYLYKKEPTKYSIIWLSDEDDGLCLKDKNCKINNTKHWRYLHYKKDTQNECKYKMLLTRFKKVLKQKDVLETINIMHSIEKDLEL